MISRYTVTIRNKSGYDQNYVIFSQPPTITSSVQPKIWSTILDAAEVPTFQTTTFELHNEPHAICARTYSGPAHGTRVAINGVEQVTLGVLNDDNSSTPGTTLRFKTGKNTPFFEKSESAASSLPNAFSITTAPDFTVAQAKDRRYLLGLGGLTSTGDKVPVAVFSPHPNVRYQIQPANTFYVACGDYATGAIVDVTRLSQPVAIDFASGRSMVKIVHTARGSMVVRV